MNIAETEAASAAVATHPRVELERDLLPNIVAENYFTAGNAAEALGQPANDPMHLLTLCILTTQNGFTIVGKSAPASPENFSEELGQKLAKDDAIRQLWPLMGYALRERLAEAAEEF